MVLLGVFQDMFEKDPLEHRVVALGGAGGDEDVVSIGNVKRIVHLPHRLVQVGANLHPVLVQRVRVAVELFEKGLHLDFDQRVDLGGGIVVQVNAHSCSSCNGYILGKIMQVLFERISFVIVFDKAAVSSVC